ncbi:MAG: SDR family NAD(P)-dependent oxidoreductase [bacterium]
MRILIVGASKGLGKAFVEGLAGDDDTVIGISRNRPKDLQLPADAKVDWISVDMSNSIQASDIIENQTPTKLDVIIYNLGIWEEGAFSNSYHFLKSSDEEIVNLINTNIISSILLLKRLIPKLLKSKRPQIVLTGSTSGLPRSGRPEVAFGASKFALRGIADALREDFREDKLAVTCLQIGDLNTEDSIAEPIDIACQRGNGSLIPLHDVVDITRALLKMSNSSYVNEITLPAILDARF